MNSHNVNNSSASAIVTDRVHELENGQGISGFFIPEHKLASHVTRVQESGSHILHVTILYMLQYQQKQQHAYLILLSLFFCSLSIS